VVSFKGGQDLTSRCSAGEGKGEENKKDTHVCIHPSQTSDYMDQLVKETVEIKLHLNSMNRKEIFRLTEAWNPNTRLLWYSTSYIFEKNPRGQTQGRAH
jgi:hypothetical protein